MAALSLSVDPSPASFFTLHTWEHSDHSDPQVARECFERDLENLCSKPRTRLGRGPTPSSSQSSLWALSLHTGTSILVCIRQIKAGRASQKWQQFLLRMSYSDIGHSCRCGNTSSPRKSPGRAPNGRRACVRLQINSTKSSSEMVMLPITTTSFSVRSVFS